MAKKPNRNTKYWILIIAPFAVIALSTLLYGLGQFILPIIDNESVGFIFNLILIVLGSLGVAAILPCVIIGVILIMANK